MRAVKKTDLSFSNGYLTTSDGEVVNNPELVYEYNEVMEVAAFNAFLKANKKKIETVGTEVTYCAKKKTPALQLAKPPMDKHEAQEKNAAAIFAELEKADHVKQTNEALARLSNLTAFITDDVVLITGVVTAEKFESNILELTEAELIKVYTDFADLIELRNKVVVIK